MCGAHDGRVEVGLLEAARTFRSRTKVWRRVGHVQTSPSHACASYRAHGYTFALSAVTKVIRSSAAVLFTRCGCGMPS